METQYNNTFIVVALPKMYTSCMSIIGLCSNEIFTTFMFILEPTIFESWV